MAQQSTAVDWASFVRDICVEYYVQKIEKTKFNGAVEIDESLFGRKVKHNVGSLRKENMDIPISGEGLCKTVSGRQT